MTTQDQNMIKEAREIVDGLIRHQRNAEDRLNNFEKQVEDLKHAQRLTAEAQIKSAPEIGNDDRELDRYVRDDGSLRLLLSRRAWPFLVRALSRSKRLAFSTLITLLALGMLS